MNFVISNLDNFLFNTSWNLLDYVYVTFQEIYAYNIYLKTNTFSSILINNNLNIFYNIIFKFIFFIKSYELFFSLIMDAIIFNFFFFFEFNENNFKNFISFIDPTMFSIYHPESILILKSIKFDLIYFSSNFFEFNVISFLNLYSLNSSVNYMFQLVIFFIIIVFFVIFFFSFFSKNKEEWQIDTEFLIANTTVEAEKELFSIDDAVNCLFFLILLFGSYFGFLFLGWSLSFTEISIFFMPLLFIFYFIVLIPFNLLYDFGFFFVAYLRGASNTSSLFFEFVYDYIGVIAFFTRLLVQFVRLILMFVVYCMMHDTVMLQVFSQQNFLLNDNFWEEIINIAPNGNSVMFFLFVSFPLRLIYWLYECLHTFFVVTVQFAAFFTIVFWLFLLFYTFFVYEKYENHFSNLSNFQKNLTLEIINLKKNK